MLKTRSLIAACVSGALLLAAAPSHAAAYFIAGKWYYFSLDFESSLAKVTGKDIKDITTVNASVDVVESNIQCANPQGKLVDPGNGPRLAIYGTSKAVTGDDLQRRDRVLGNVFKTTTKVELPTEPPMDANPCKDPAGVAEWKPTYWRYDICDRGTSTAAGRACYSDLAVKVNGVLVYVEGGGLVPDPENWRFVLLPTVFSYTSTLVTGTPTLSDPSVSGICRFPANNEPGAAFPGQPYSLSNPPVAGWAAAPVDYECTGLPSGN